MKIRPLFTVSRASNGWLVDIFAEYLAGPSRTVLCMTWAEVEEVMRAEAFPYPNKDEPRGP